MAPCAAASAALRVRNVLNLATDYDRRLRERWVGEWSSALRAGGTVLDAGAGDLHLATHLRLQHYIGLDIRPRFSDRRLSALKGDLHALPIAGSSIDNIVSIEVLEHVRDPLVALSELSRVLRPGGELCISVPQAGAEHEQPFDYFRFTRFSLTDLAQRAGLEVREIRMKGFFFRRLSAELRDLPFVVLPEQNRYRFQVLALLLRWALVALFTFVFATLLLPLDALDRNKTYTTGYFCIFAKPVLNPSAHAAVT